MPESARAYFRNAGAIVAAAEAAKKRLLLDSIQVPFIYQHKRKGGRRSGCAAPAREANETSESEVAAQLNFARSPVGARDLTEAGVLRGAAGGVGI